MGSKTKIVVLHMKEIIYTVIFLVLGLLLIFLLVIMFRTGDKPSPTPDKASQYHPGIYTSSFNLNNTQLEVEVTVDASDITAVRFSNMDDSIAAMFPLVQPAIEEIAEQVCAEQTTEGIALSDETPYTSQIILNAIEDAVEKATVK